MKRIILFILAALLLAPGRSVACSDFRLQAKDGTVVIGRSMEFPVDLKSEVCVVPRGAGKYGFLGINAFGLKGTYVDGFNEQGLSLDGLMFTGAVYEPEVAGRSLPIDEFGTWLLGNYATVAEVKAALAAINITAAKNHKLKDLGMHLAVHDATGHSLVVEFIGGQKKVYDNPLGVMTNRPGFDWQLANLRNYVNLNAQDREPRMLNGVRIEPTGVGSGLHGLPGDWTPPSRFVKLAFSVDAALKPRSAAEAVNLAEHLLNTVDIPKGAIKEPTALPFKYLYGFAQWVVIKDLTSKVLYYKTYENTVWRSVDLKQFDLAPGKAVKTLSLAAQGAAAIDVSGKLEP
jgi:choloylglycine hydrolase